MGKTLGELNLSQNDDLVILFNALLSKNTEEKVHVGEMSSFSAQLSPILGSHLRSVIILGNSYFCRTLSTSLVLN